MIHGHEAAARSTSVDLKTADVNLHLSNGLKVLEKICIMSLLSKTGFSPPAALEARRTQRIKNYALPGDIPPRRDASTVNA
jgi:hypothetical protein